MLRFSIINLLNTIGEPSTAAGGRLALTSDKLTRAYKSTLGGDLRDHATALGCETADDLLNYLFSDRVVSEYGVETLIDPKNNLLVASSLSRAQARRQASLAGMIEFRPETHGDGENDASPRMIHTGLARLKDPSSGKAPRYAREPLGAALRVSPFDEAAERYGSGDELNAFVYSYDVQGDNDSPLLVLTADDPRGKSGNVGSNKRRRIKLDSNNLVDDSTIERELTSIRPGDGPYKANVVAVSDHSFAAFVDCGVGRRRGKKQGGGTVRVLGMLRFDEFDGESRIDAGDTLEEVYIRSVSPQSGRFMVTLDSSVGEKKAIDFKREKQAEKRKERLSKHLSVEDITSLIGQEYHGVVKATSKSGDWYYVQPCADADDTSQGGECQVNALPVGIARFEGEDGGRQFESGDNLRVRLNRIDEGRGQLSLTILR